jgi:hypothetical protein
LTWQSSVASACDRSRLRRGHNQERLVRDWHEPEFPHTGLGREPAHLVSAVRQDKSRDRLPCDAPRTETNTRPLRFQTIEQVADEPASKASLIRGLIEAAKAADLKPEQRRTTTGHVRPYDGHAGLAGPDLVDHVSGVSAVFGPAPVSSQRKPSECRHRSLPVSATTPTSLSCHLFSAPARASGKLPWRTSHPA